MSPSILPSTCTSPAEISVPFTISSELITDGTSLALARLGGGVGVADGVVVSASLLFENIALCLYLPASIMSGPEAFLSHCRSGFFAFALTAQNGHSPAA